MKIVKSIVNFLYNQDDESKKMSLATRYKAESEVLEKKLSTFNKLCSKSCSDGDRTDGDGREEAASGTVTIGQQLNASSKRLRAKSFHNLLSLSCNQRRCCLPPGQPPPPPPASLSLSQQIQFHDLKQFKSTLECVKYLSKMQVSADRTNLSMRNLGRSGAGADACGEAKGSDQFSLERIKRQLEQHRRIDEPIVVLDKKDDYERQGARPKIRSQSKKTEIR